MVPPLSHPSTYIYKDAIIYNILILEIGPPYLE